MTFKQFKNECYNRACNGKWPFEVAIGFVGIATDISSLWFWKREKEFKKLDLKYNFAGIFKEIDEHYEG